MKVIELVELTKAASPTKLKGIPDAQAVALLRVAFGEILKAIEKSGDDPFSIYALGTFRIKNVKSIKDGEITTTKRIVFKPAPAKLAN